MRKEQKPVSEREISAAERESIRVVTKEELQELLDHPELATAALSDDLADHEWHGGAEAINVEAIVAKGLFPTTLLEDVVLAIIDGYDEVRTPRARRLLSSRNARLNSAMKSIAGQKSKKRDEEKERKFTRVAQRYFKGVLGFPRDKDKFLDAILFEEFFPDKRAREKDRSNHLKYIRPEFEANKHRLLIKVSYRGVEEAHARKVKLVKIVKQLRAFGIPARIKESSP